jgi:SAM-dependent methyltransferase
VPDISISLVPGSAPRQLSAAELAAVRDSRRRPRRTQFDYLHARRVVDDLAARLRRVEQPVRDALDVWCGSRPYEDLLPAGVRWTGFDVPDNPYGVADVVSAEFLPFEDASFDVVLCVEAFQWIRDPRHAVAEFRRVLRPGGTAIVTLPYAYEYDRTNFERRYTGNELVELFDGWDAVELSENGGRGVAWAVLTGSMLDHAVGRGRVAHAAWPLLAATYATINAVGTVLAWVEDRHGPGSVAFPMNLMVAARRPAGG